MSLIFLVAKTPPKKKGDGDEETEGSAGTPAPESAIDEQSPGGALTAPLLSIQDE